MARYSCLRAHSAPLLLSSLITAISIGHAQAAEVPRRSDVKPDWPDDAGVVHYIDAQLRAEQQTAYAGRFRQPARHRAPPLEFASDAQWCRRVFLDVLGRIPRIDELRRFSTGPAETKKVELVEQLLTSDAYTEEYAHFWTMVWSNVLVGRRPADPTQPSLTNREGLQKYLYHSLLRDKPYDVLIYELLTATGSTTPGDEDFNGATNYLVEKLRGGGASATEHVGRALLGQRMQCAQCHCDPFSNRKPPSFWGLNAFFRQARVTSRDIAGQLHATLTDGDFVSDTGDREEAEVYFELLCGKIGMAYPQFVDGTRIDPSGDLEKVNRRQELARLVIRSDDLSKMVVSRLWAHFLGYGLSDPVDDLEIGSYPRYRELLSTLGREFVAQRYDLKKLIRWCVLSEAYGRSSRIFLSNEHDQPTPGDAPLYTRFYVRRMQPEQAYASILTAVGSSFSSITNETLISTDDVRHQLATAFHLESDRSLVRASTIPQILFMMNGPLTARAMSDGPTSFLNRLATSSIPDQKGLEQTFLATVGRKPSAADLAVAGEIEAAYRANRLPAYQDIWWALLNSNEFILIH